MSHITVDSLPSSLGIAIAIDEDHVGLACTLFRLSHQVVSKVYLSSICIVVTPSTDLLSLYDIINFYHLHDITQVIVKQKSGIYDAYNTALQRLSSASSHIVFLGSYDIIFLESIPFLHPGTTAFCKSFLPSRNRIHPLYKNSYLRLLFNNCHQSIFYSTSYLVERPYSLLYPILADFAINLTVYSSGLFEYYDTVTSIHNDFNGLSKTQYDYRFWQNYPAILRANGVSFSLSCLFSLIHLSLTFAAKLRRLLFT